MDLFERAVGVSGEPLAARMRPRTLDEFFGQEHIVGVGRLLRRVIQADRLSSLIFYGPPGTGKTSLARIIANTTKSHFITLNAVLSGVKDLRESIAEAKDNRDLYGRRTILFIDEVHRWNKAQQDALLPWVENGTVILVGATTENPYFEVNSALVSRSRIFQLKSLTSDDLRKVAEQTLADPERGYGQYTIEFDKDALSHLVDIASGDARSLLNAMELAVETTPASFPPKEGEVTKVTLETAEESIQKKVVLYDKEGDYHYDVISAFIKSLRGSDPDAVLYWLARMVSAGEEPHYIFRRMLIFAGEDVGLADPLAVGIVESAASAFDRVGLPEGRFHLSQAALYLATAPKSNSTLGLFEAMTTIEKEAAGEVPNHLRDGSRDKEGFGHGEGYLYPHAFNDHWVAQQYLPSGLQGKVFYNPSNQGHEGDIHDQVIRRRDAQVAAVIEDVVPEILTNSPRDRKRELWLQRTTSGSSIVLSNMRDRLFDLAKPSRHATVLVDGDAGGLLMKEALRRCPEGGVWVTTQTPEQQATLISMTSELPEIERPTVLGPGKAELNNLETNVEFVIGRNVLTRIADRPHHIKLLCGILASSGIIALAEVLPYRGQRLSSFLESSVLDPTLVRALMETEDIIYSSLDNVLVNWSESDIVTWLAAEGMEVTATKVESCEELRSIRREDLDLWFNVENSGTYGAVLSQNMQHHQILEIKRVLTTTLTQRLMPWRSDYAIIKAEKTGEQYERPRPQSIQ